MPKIEIELDEINRLEDRIERLEVRNKELSRELKSIDKKHLRKQCETLALSLYQKYLRKTFNALGFNIKDTTFFNHVVFPEHGRLNDDFFRETNIKGDISVRVTKQFKQAIIELGISEDAFTDSSQKDPLSVDE